MAKQICSVNRFALLLMVCTICAVTAPVFADDTGTGPVSVALPFIFIENQGKYPLEVKYYTETADKVFFFTDNGTVISGVMDEDTGGDLLFGSVEMILAGKRPDASVIGFEKSDGVINYLLGSDPEAWMTDVPAYTKILYSDLYPGIDLSLSGKDGLIKREYILDAYADPGLIRMQYSGADGISLGSDGSLIVNTPFGPVYEQAPRSYQIEDGEEQTVASAFVILDEETVGFLVGAYDETKELIIDPYIAYSSYLGGTYEDQGFGIAADDNGNAYICGYTASCNFPNTTTPCINPLLSPNYRGGRTLNGTTDAFVTKIHQAGSANATLEFSTYLGGNNLDFGRGIDIDIAGNMYVCGNTFSTDFPVKNAWSYGLSNGGALAGQDDAFVTKLHRTGTYIVYSSYIGGEGSDRANAIAVHTDGSAYITGETTGNFQFKAPETRYPVTSGAYQEVPNPDALMGDAFATKLNPNGNLLTYSTYISGHSNDVGNGIAVDDFGYAYIVGSTVSSNLVPAGVPGKYKTLQGGGDAFIFKMNFAGGNPVSYASYLGGKTGWDYGTAVAVDAEGCAYMTGATASTDFPMEKPKQSTKGYPQDNFDKDAFVTKFASDGDSLEYSTYLGGSKEDYGLGIAVDDLDRAYVTGYTKSSGFPKYLSLKYTNNGNQEVFVTCYQPDMRYFEYSTTFGGYYDDVGAAVAVDSGYSAYIAGYTKSPSEYQCDPTTCPDTFPVRLWLDDTYVGNNLTGNYDAFITKLGHSSITVDFVANETIIQEEDWVLFTDLSTYSDEIDWWFWDFGDGNTESSSIQYNPEHQYNTSGIYDVTLTLNPVYGSEVSKTRTQYIRVCGTPPVVNFTVQGFPQATEPVNISVNTAKTFLANITPSQAMSSYQWNFEDGTGNATTANPSHTFTVPGAYNVTLTVTDACGTGISTQRTANGLGYVHVYAPPYVAFNGTPRELCANGTTPVQFYYDYTLRPDGQFYEPISFLWSFGDGYTSTERNPSHLYDAAGNFTVSLTGTNPAGSATSTVAEYISVEKNPVAIFTRTPDTGPSPLTVQFTDTSTGNPFSWNWDFGDGNTSTLQNPSHTYYTPGSYDVNLTVGAYCTADYYPWPNCIRVIGGFYPDFLLNTTGYLPNNMPVNGTSPLPVTFGENMNETQGLVDTYWWDYEGDGTWDVGPVNRVGGDPPDNTIINTTHTYTALGNYTPVLRVANNSWVLDYTTGTRFADYIGVYAPLVANFTATPTTAVVSQIVSFTDTSTGGPVAWAWQFGDGTANATTQHPTHAYSTPGTYAVNLTITNAWGARNSTQSNPNITVLAANMQGLIYVLNQTVTAPITVISGANSWREVPVYLNQTDIGIDNYKSTTSLNRTDRAAYRNSAIRPSWIAADKFTWAVSPASSPYNKVAISGYSVTGGLPIGSGPVPLGNITISGLANGTTQLSFTMGASDTYCQKAGLPLVLSSNPVNLTSYYLNPFTGYVNRPQDLNHDGLVDDFDGNGVANSQDVIVFFHALTAGECSATPAPFDYDGNGVANLNDLIVFYTNCSPLFPFS